MGEFYLASAEQADVILPDVISPDIIRSDIA